MDKILQLLDGVPVLPDEQIWWMIDHASRVDKQTFKVLAILLTVVASIGSIARLIFRYRSERTLYLEDWLVTFATTCLIAETGLLLSFVKILYLIDAATLHLPVLAFILRDAGLTSQMLKSGTITTDAYLTLGWVTIFVIKYSFLALFYRMLINVSRRLRAYFWCTVAATSTSCLVVMLESFILCPHFGGDAAQCFLRNNYTFSIASGAVVQCLDIVTDLMIISIPLILLRMTHLQLHHKIRVAVVLCLSTVCIVLSIVRLAGGIERNVFGNLQFGTIWISFMLHCEAAVAVMAGSAPALRAIYTSRRDRKTLYGGEDERKPTLKSRVSGAFTSIGKPKSVPPSEERSHTPIANWPQSIAGFMPRRLGSKSTRPLVNTSGGRKGSADSSIIHPTLAYHDYRKMEGNGITVTHETTVSSESAIRKSWDLDEARSHTGTVLSARNSPTNFINFAFPEPAATGRKPDFVVDEQFGMISAGMHV